MTELPLNQIAISVSDVQRSQRWYRDLFGYLEAGGTSMFIPLLGADKVQGLPQATSTCWWLMDRQHFFQLEFFQFRKPLPKALPSDWRPCDIGYTTIGIHVADFDATLQRAALRRVVPLTAPVGAPGERRVCVRDPDGVLIEIMEDDPRGVTHRDRPYDAPTVTRFVTLSVPDLAKARRTWIDVLGLPEEHDVVLHTASHESLWGLQGATRESFLLRAGDMFIEVVQYLDPVGAPWPDDYQVSHLGLLNVALGLNTYDEVKAMVDKCEAAGIPPNAPPPTTLKPIWSCSYVNDPMGFSIELLYVAKPGKKQPVNPFHLFELGFRPTPAPVTRSSAKGLCSAPAEVVWRVLTDHERMSEWAPFKRSKVTAEAAGGAQVGTIRELSGGPAGMKVTETVVVAEEPYRPEYTATGAPGLNSYRGFVTLERLPGGGTRIVWDAQFKSPLPGAGSITRRMLRSLVTGLISTAEREAVSA